MDPITTCCPNLLCSARGQTGEGNRRIHARQDQRFLSLCALPLPYRSHKCRCLDHRIIRDEGHIKQPCCSSD